MKINLDSFLFVKEFMLDMEFMYEAYTGYPFFLRNTTNLYLNALDNDWVGVAEKINIIKESLSYKHDCASFVEKKMTLNNPILDFIDDAQKAFDELTAEKFPFSKAIDLLVIFLLKNIGKTHRVNVLILEFMFHLMRSKVVMSPALHQIFCILYYMLYFKNPYYNNGKMTQEDKEKYEDLIRKLAKRLLFLILSSNPEDGKLQNWDIKFIIFFFFITFRKKIKEANAEYKWHFVSAWWAWKLGKKD